MLPRRILVVYGTTHGQTEKVALRVADRLKASGHAVRVLDGDALPRSVSARDFEAVVVGSSVTYGRHQRCIRRFVQAQRDALNQRPTAFVSISGSAAGHSEAERAEAQRYVDAFLGETGWRPGHIASVAGAMAYTRYNPLLRWMIRRMAAKNGGPTDTSRDHELTDWAQVDRLADAFGAALASAPTAAAAAEPALV